MVPPVRLILKMDLFALNDRITDKCPAVQIFPFHVNCGDLMIFVSGVVVDALGGIAAGCVECDLIFAVWQLHSSLSAGQRSQGYGKTG